jgi:hypothetical protein
MVLAGVTIIIYVPLVLAVVSNDARISVMGTKGSRLLCDANVGA